MPKHLTGCKKRAKPHKNKVAGRPLTQCHKKYPSVLSEEKDIKSLLFRKSNKKKNSTLQRNKASSGISQLLQKAPRDVSWWETCKTLPYTMHNPALYFMSTYKIKRGTSEHHCHSESAEKVCHLLQEGQTQILI